MSRRRGPNTVATWLALPFVVAGAAAAIGRCADDPPRDARAELVLLDGSTRQVDSLEIQNDKLFSAGQPIDLEIDDLLRIELANSNAARPAPTVVIELAGGGKLLADEVTIAHERCRIRWLDEPLSVPLEGIRSIRFALPTNSDDFERAKAAPPAAADRVFLCDDARQTTSVAATVEALDGERLTLEVSGHAQYVLRSRLLGIVVAQPAANDPPPFCLARFSDGSRLGGGSLSLAKDRGELKLIGGGEVSFRRSQLASVEVRSPRVAFLAERKPTSEDQEPIVTPPFPAQRNRSVSDGPLQIGSQTFATGLGVHARSTISFATENKWDLLCATIGLDAAAEGKGDCVFVVLADGEKLLERRMRGSEAQPIQVPISGRSHITLCVEPGENLDLADHANWAEVRFVRNR